MKSKYIVLKDMGANRVPVAIVFPELLTHLEMARRFGGESQVLGAGFVSISMSTETTTRMERSMFNELYEVTTAQGRLNILAYGRSDSLDISSRPEDTVLVKKALGIIDD
jgi:hypothetical protein